MTKPYPDELNYPLEYQRDELLYKKNTPKPPVTLDAFIKWVETYHGEAQTFIWTLKYWRNKYVEETI